MTLRPNIADPNAITSFLETFPFDSKEAKAAFVKLCSGLIKKQKAEADGAFRDFSKLKRVPEKAPSWLQEAFDKGLAIHVLTPSRGLYQELELLSFWMEKAYARGEKWTQDYAAFTKRTAFSSLDAAQSSALSDLKKWRILTEFYERNGQLKIIHCYQDGACMVEILTTEEMDRDGKKNQICIGGKSSHAVGHQKDLIEHKARFFSLRDASNDTHATLKLDEKGNVGEIKGKQNAPVSKKYDPYILDFLEVSPFIQSVSAGPIATGIYTHNRRYYSYRRLPSGLTFDDLDLSLTEGVILPETMYVDKKLCLNGNSPPASVPAGVVAGQFFLEWKTRHTDGWGWGLHRDGQPARLIFDSLKRLSGGQFYLEGQIQARTLSDQELQLLRHPLIFEKKTDFTPAVKSLPAPKP